jgi:hypothetical protein
VTSKGSRYKRILALQQQILRIEVMRLASVNTALRNLQSREAGLIEKLGDNCCLASNCADVLIEGLKSAARLRQELTMKANAHATTAREQNVKVRQVEQMAANAKNSLEREFAENNLKEIIEWEIGPAKVSAR